MKKMGIEAKIRSELIQGASIKHLTDNMGFKRSTVYKVQNSIQTVSKHITPQWSIENIRFNKYDGHYDLGEAVRVTFGLKNNSKMDLYIRKIGIQTEWMKNEGKWVFHKVNEMADKWWLKYYTLDFVIPKETKLNKSKIEFLIEGAFIPQEELPIMYNQSNTTLFINSQ